MRGVTRNLTTGILITLLATSPVFALDGGTIDRWLNSMEELQAWGDDQPDTMDEDFSAEMEDPMDFDFGALLERSLREHGEARSIIQNHGFNAEEWTNIGTRIFQAFVAIEMERQSADVENEMARALQQMEDNPHMTEQQKETMRQQMQQTQQMMNGMTNDVPAEDLRAAKSRRDRLIRVFDVDE